MRRQPAEPRAGSTVDPAASEQPEAPRAAHRGATLPYAAGLDGLRAVAVLAVLLYHARDITGLPSILRPSSGFLGVEVFFVISGYLITSLLLSEHTTSGTISLGGFWARRARRLLPALYLLLLGTVALAFLAGDAAGAIRQELAAAVLYVSNWLLIFQDVSYFEAAGRPSLLRHLWSLAVEEQFYLLWPLVVFVGLRWFGRRALFAFTVIGAIGSTALAWMLFDQLPRYGDVTAIYYRTDARAGGLLIGAAAAFYCAPKLAAATSAASGRSLRRGLAGLLLNATGLVALATILWVQYAFSDQVVDWAANERLYHAGFLFTSIPTIVLIAVVVRPGNLLGRILGNPVMRWIGTRSYGLYLWHWPIYQLTRPRLDVEIDGWSSLAVRLAITVLLAELSYRLVEMPIRERRFVRSVGSVIPLPSRRVVLTAVGNASAIAAVAALALTLQTGVPGTQSSPQAPTTETVSRMATPSPLAGASRLVANRRLPLELSDAASRARRTPENTAPFATGPASAWASAPSATAGTAIFSGTPSTPGTGAEPNVAGVTPVEAVVIEPPPSDAALLSATATPPPTGTTTPTATPVASPPALTGGAASASASEPPTDGSPTPAAATLGDATVTIVGDSVVLGASTELVKIGDGVTVYAQVGRQWYQVAEELRLLADNGQLADTVVIQLGNNGTLTKQIFDDVMAVLADAEHVLFVNVRVPRVWESDVNAAIAAGVARYSSRAQLVDWYTTSNEHPEYFLPDGVHLQQPGREALRELIEGALAD